MPVKIPQYPALKTKKAIFVIEEQRAYAGHTPAAHCVLNLMPLKLMTETDL